MGEVPVDAGLGERPGGSGAALNERQRRTKRKPRGILLEGGPMDGWFVKEDASALRRDWSDFWPGSLRAKWSPGRYVRRGTNDRGVKIAVWREKE